MRGRIPGRLMKRRETHCRLSFLHRPVGDDAEAWPFAYRAEQVARGVARGPVRITLELVENMDTSQCRPVLACIRFFPGAPVCG